MRVVEFYPPADMAALAALRLDSNPPVVKRVLHRIPPVGEAVPATVEMGKARFLGGLVDEQPTEYPPPAFIEAVE